jgi:predicted nucleic acid-binding protein
MRRLLDTRICFFLIRTKAASMRERIDSFQIGYPGVSAINEVENNQKEFLRVPGLKVEDWSPETHP